MDSREKEVADLIKFDIAEKVILDTAIDNLVSSAERLKKAIDDENGSGMVDAWRDMGESTNYVGTILNLKTTTAARKWIEQKAGE